MHEINTDATPGSGRLVPKLVEHFVDLVKLNLLHLLFCLPIVTIPAACTAASYLCYKMISDQPYSFLKGFLLRFRREFLRSPVCGLIYAVLLAGILLPLSTLLQTVFQTFTLVSALIAAFLILCLGFVYATAVYVFALLGIVQLPVPAILRNAVRLAVCRPLAGMKAFLFCVLLTAAMILTFPFTVPFLLVFYYSPILFAAIYLAKDGINLCIA